MFGYNIGVGSNGGRETMEVALECHHETVLQPE
jgi:hypothetical protein